MSSQAKAPREPALVSDGTKVPKYYLLKQEILKKIDALAPGEALPSERLLSIEYGTSRTTVRQAFQELVVEGRLQRVHGSGTYVSSPKLAQALQLTSYTQDMRSRGLEPSSRLLHLTTLRADASLAERLAIDPGAKVLRIQRLRMTDGEPRAIETSHLAAERFPRLRQHLTRLGSLYAALSEVYGVELASAEQTIETVLARPEDALLLETDVGLPMLLLSRHSFDDAGEPVEWAQSVYRGDRYKFIAWLHRPGEPEEADPHRPRLVIAPSGASARAR